MDDCSQTEVTICQNSLRTSNPLQVITKQVPLLDYVRSHFKKKRKNKPLKERKFSSFYIATKIFCTLCILLDDQAFPEDLYK